MFFIIFFLEIISIYINSPTLLCVGMILIFQSVTDYINNDVYTVFNVLLAFVGIAIYGVNIINLIKLILPLFLIFINKLINGMGLGDIELLFSLSFILNLYELILVLFIASLLNLVYATLIRKEIYAFVPFLTIATIIVQINIYII